MDWQLAPTGSLVRKTQAYGDARPILFDSAAPYLAELAPWLPWQVHPTSNNKILDYAPWAAVMWWFLLQDDAVCTNDVDLHATILKPAACLEVLNAVKSAGFTTQATAYGPLTTDIQAFVTQKRLPETFLQAKHLELIDPAPVGDQPGAPHEYIVDIKLSTMVDNTSGSYGPLGLFEFFSAPRLTTQSRFEMKMPFMMLFKSLFRLQSKYNVDLSERLSDGELATEDDIQSMFADLVADFFSNSEMPNCIITTTGKTFDKKCTQRTFLFNAMTSWQFAPTSRDAAFSKYFISVAQSFSEVAAVVLPAPSAATAKLSAEQLVAGIVGPNTPLSIATLASAQSKLMATSLATEVKLPENASKLGTEKLHMLMRKVSANVPNGFQSVGSISTSTSSGRSELSMTPETQTWLNSKAVMEIEQKLTACFATAPPSYHAAIMAVARSRMPLVIRMLTWRTSLGK